MSDLKITSLCFEGLVMKSDRKLICSEIPPHVRAYVPSLERRPWRPHPLICDGKQKWIRKKKKALEKRCVELLRWVLEEDWEEKKKQTNPITSLKTPHTVISMCNFLGVAFLVCYANRNQDGAGDTTSALSQGTLASCSSLPAGLPTIRASARSHGGWKGGEITLLDDSPQGLMGVSG